MRIAIFSFWMVLFFSPVLQALETDQYMAWNQNLNDVLPELNAMMNEEIDSFLEQFNKNENRVERSCPYVAKNLMKNFRTIFKRKFENWLSRHENIDRYPQSHINVFEFYRRSIYYSATFPFFLPLSRTIQADGILLGTDKLTHFATFGRLYLDKFLQQKMTGKGHLESIHAAIDLGIDYEYGITGKLSSGVFSYADLEANYQGFKFAYSLCFGDRPRLEKNNRFQWIMDEPLDMAIYINPHWDEVYNNSTYRRDRWNSVKKHLIRLCDQQRNTFYGERLSFYQQNEQSGISLEYLKEKQKRGEIPDQRKSSFYQLCSL